MLGYKRNTYIIFIRNCQRVFQSDFIIHSHKLWMKVPFAPHSTIFATYSHYIYVCYSVNVVKYVLDNSKLTLNFWDKTHLVMMCYHFAYCWILFAHIFAGIFVSMCTSNIIWDFFYVAYLSGFSIYINLTQEAFTPLFSEKKNV